MALSVAHCHCLTLSHTVTVILISVPPSQEPSIWSLISVFRNCGRPQEKSPDRSWLVGGCRATPSRCRPLSLSVPLCPCCFSLRFSVFASLSSLPHLKQHPTNTITNIGLYLLPSFLTWSNIPHARCATNACAVKALSTAAGDATALPTCLVGHIKAIIGCIWVYIRCI